MEGKEKKEAGGRAGGEGGGRKKERDCQMNAFNLKFPFSLC